jgi:hypothetical protein
MKLAEARVIENDAFIDVQLSMSSPRAPRAPRAPTESSIRTLVQIFGTLDRSAWRVVGDDELATAPWPSSRF